MESNGGGFSRTRLTPLECLVLALGVAFFCRLQFATPHILGPDGYLHIRMAELLRTLGPGYSFHWARFSTFADHFSDRPTF